MRNRFSAALALSLLAAGCAHQQSKTVSQKEEATRNWNAARAGVLASLASDQFKAGNLDKCRQTLDDALKLTPDSEPLHVLSGKVDIEQGRPEPAEKELVVARKLAPADPEPCYLLGVVYQRWQKYETAYESYKAAADLAPSELAYLLAEEEMLVAMDRGPEALRLLQDKVAFFEHSATIRDAAGQLLVEAGRPKEAVEMFRQAAVLSEDDPSIRERLAMALYASEEYRESAQVLAKLTQNAPFSNRADLFLVMGECQLLDHRPREARYSFQSATQLDADSAPAWQGLGRAAVECGDLRRAELALQKAVSLDGAVSETHLIFGYLRLRQDRPADALAEFQKASALDGGDTVSLCMVGYALQKMGQPLKARQFYSRALQMNPSDSLASQLLAGAGE